mmetsp:Transcript_15377/g.20373  ORF Transcript_15377/g.20373 Transcript_15377/m.20373 type:complete len:353 (-) Transcript_15377:3224-4282(-)
MEWRTRVKALAKKHKYDFQAMASEIGNGVTAKDVRIELAAQRFGNTKTKPSNEAVILNEQKSPSEVENNSSIHNDLSWEALLAAQDEAALEHRKKREAVFDRVLTAIGGGVAVDIGHSPAETTWASARKAQELEEAKAAARQAEIDEWRDLARQREKLRQRFNHDSVDAVGEDPLSKEKVNSENDNQSECSQIGLDTSGLDQLLDDLERDQESIECSNELEKLFQFMDTAATAKSSYVNAVESPDKSAINVSLYTQPPFEQVTPIVMEASPNTTFVEKATSETSHTTKLPPNQTVDFVDRAPFQRGPSGRSAIYSYSDDGDDASIDDEDDIDWHAWRKSHKQKNAELLSTIE